MHNQDLVFDYLKRAKARIAAIKTLYTEASWADVVRESQEVTELVLKALLRAHQIDPPRIHDVSELLLTHQASITSLNSKTLEKLARLSRSLRRDRELSFYGSEDLTPSEFYKQEDADKAFDDAKEIFQVVDGCIKK